MSNGKVFCVIPAYNEEKTIKTVIENVKPFISEVIVVDDGSIDNTFAEASRRNAFARAVVLRHIINRGQGAALQTGVDYALLAGADIIVHFDADGQFVAREIKDIVRPIIDGEADIVFGSRFLGKKSYIPWFKRNIIMSLARIANRIFLGINLTDPQSGFRAISAKAAKKIKIEQDKMAHCSEILHKAFSYNLRVKETPITVIYHDFGQKFSGGLKILKELFLGRMIG